MCGSVDIGVTCNTRLARAPQGHGENIPAAADHCRKCVGLLREAGLPGPVVMGAGAFSLPSPHRMRRRDPCKQVVNRAALPVSRATKRFVLAEHCLQLASSPSVKSKCVPVAITFRDIDSQEHLDKLDRRRREGDVYLDPIDPTACETVSVSTSAGFRTSSVDRGVLHSHPLMCQCAHASLT